MNTQLSDLKPQDVELMPIDRLGLLALNNLVETNQETAHNFINDLKTRKVPQHILCYWEEALNWLITKNLVARSRRLYQSSTQIFVTRLGHKVLEKGLELIRVSELIDVSLHDRLIKIRSQFLIGEYELAAFAALREVEIRVRELANENSSLLGVKLMRKVFGENGVLADKNLDPGERVGIMELFAGAVGTFKNPPSHRQVDYANPTEASEVILLADLLMRLLDRYEMRKNDN
jgi:uncharacterized protein (TIGR02391 family)